VGDDTQLAHHRDHQSALRAKLLVCRSAFLNTQIGVLCDSRNYADHFTPAVSAAFRNAPGKEQPKWMPSPTQTEASRSKLPRSITGPA
jgi:hypothetical protein